MSGEIEVRKGETLIDYREFGRIAAQTAKQVLIQKFAKTSGPASLTNTWNKRARLSPERFRGLKAER